MCHGAAPQGRAFCLGIGLVQPFWQDEQRLHPQEEQRLQELHPQDADELLVFVLLFVPVLVPATLL